MSRLIKIITGEHAGTVAHVTSRVPQYGLVNVTPIYGDLLVSLQFRTHQVESVTGFWSCNKCHTIGITSHAHNGCDQGAVFIQQPRESR